VQYTKEKERRDGMEEIFVVILFRLLLFGEKERKNDLGKLHTPFSKETERDTKKLRKKAINDGFLAVCHKSSAREASGENLLVPHKFHL
jgi:hypothetical protein